jgi:NTE family protein
MTAKTIELALQGGGAHGAFTWGVLDRLLEDPGIRVEAVSGTSAGAMNAVVLAHGLETGGVEGARAQLSRFWRAISDAGRASPLQRTPLDRLLGRWTLDWSPGYVALDLMSRLVSPYQLNPFDYNPLRDVLAAAVDFDAVNRCTAVRVFVTATDVETGQAAVFRQPDLSADAVLASACLPFLFKAVEIGGRHYWDGGYMGNPALFPLVDECPTRDLVLVQVNPIFRSGPPTTAPDILNRLNEITFNASLLNELRAIVLLKELIDAEGLEDERYRSMRIHRIHGAQALCDLGVSSKLNTEWAFLEHLRDAGRAVTDAWLAANREKIGAESTMDVEALFAGSFRPVFRRAVAAARGRTEA